MSLNMLWRLNCGASFSVWLPMWVSYSHCARFYFISFGVHLHSLETMWFKYYGITYCILTNMVVALHVPFALLFWILTITWTQHHNIDKHVLMMRVNSICCTWKLIKNWAIIRVCHQKWLLIYFYQFCSTWF